MRFSLSRFAPRTSRAVSSTSCVCLPPCRLASLAPASASPVGALGGETLLRAHRALLLWDLGPCSSSHQRDSPNNSSSARVCPSKAIPAPPRTGNERNGPGGYLRREGSRQCSSPVSDFVTAWAEQLLATCSSRPPKGAHQGILKSAPPRSPTVKRCQEWATRVTRPRRRCSLRRPAATRSTS